MIINYHDDNIDYSSLKQIKKRNIMLRLMLIKFALMIIIGAVIAVVGFTLFMGVTGEVFTFLSAIFLLLSFFGLLIMAKGLGDFFNFFDKY